MLPRLLIGTALLACVAAPAADAASVAYSEGGNIVLASPDGAAKLALTTDGTPIAPYYTAAQSANGVTVAARQEQFDSPRAVLHKWNAADGAHAAANVMPRNALYTDTVMPIRLDIDAAGKTVAFGYSTCGIGGCINRTNGYWLTFADHGPANPSSPQGSSGLVAPSFHGDRIVSSDTFKIMAQEAINAPFNDGHAGWIDPGNAGARFWAAEVRPDGKAIALEFSSPGTGFGVVLAAADGTLGGATELKCFLPAAGEAQDVSWSPDGTMLAWADDQGVKVARAPDLSQPPAAEDKCVLGSAPKVALRDSGDGSQLRRRRRAGDDRRARQGRPGAAIRAPARARRPTPGSLAVAVSAPEKVARQARLQGDGDGAGRRLRGRRSCCAAARSSAPAARRPRRPARSR